MSVLVLGVSEIQAILDPDELIDALAEGFTRLSRGEVIAPPRNEVAIPDAGFVLAMPAWQPGAEISVKLVSVFEGNPRHGLPSHQALICLLDPATGTPVGVLDGTYITAMRTAAAAALSVRLLARGEAPVLAIVGAGVQGRSHLAILPRVRPFREIRIASLHRAHAERLAATDPRAHAVASAEAAVRGADVVCLCTHAHDPVIRGEWVGPGTHVTSVGYAPPGGELPRELVEPHRLFVETRLAFRPPPAGCAELAGLEPGRAAELGEVLLGQRPGREFDAEITVYKAMGHAMEDMVAAHLVYRRARETGAGHLIDL